MCFTMLNLCLQLKNKRVLTFWFRLEQKRDLNKHVCKQVLILYVRHINKIDIKILS